MTQLGSIEHFEKIFNKIENIPSKVVGISLVKFWETGKSIVPATSKNIAPMRNKYVLITF